MSGGHYDYFYFNMAEYAERIKDESHELDASSELKELMWHFGYQLGQMAFTMKTIEWYMSGDHSEQTAINILKSKESVDE